MGKIMNVGFINFYPSRPHGFHSGFMDYLLKSYGLNTYFLECGFAFNKCVCSKLNQSYSGLLQWARCQVGRASHYNRSAVSKIITKIPKNQLSSEEVSRSLLSSVLAYYREEINTDYENNPILAQSIEFLKSNYLKSYYSTLSFIEKRNIEALIVFNGRIDVTRAAIDAAEKAKINYITHDRPFMGHGIQINANQNIIGLKERIVMNSKYDDKPLSLYQARLAGVEIAKRFLGKNYLEWRLNKTNNKLSSWPTSTQNQKILIVPSSIFEKYGHDDWNTPWKSSTNGFDLLLKSIGAKKEQIVVRFHPQWSQKKRKISGQSSRQHYLNWCKKNSYFYIDSDDKTSTLDLIDKCDMLVVNDSTAMVEGGSLGKKIVNLGPSGKDGSKFFVSLLNQHSINNFNSLSDWIPKDEIIRKALRYTYTNLARYPQYFNYVRGVSTTECIAYEGADPKRLVNMLKTGHLIADDEMVGSNTEENEIIELISNQSWDKIIELAPNFETPERVPLNLSRSFPFNLIDNARKNLKRGDF